MVTHELIDLINFVDSIVNKSNNLSDLITRINSVISTMIIAMDNIKNAFAWLFYFIPKNYFIPLITLVLIIMFLKIIMAIVNLVYP